MDRETYPSIDVDSILPHPLLLVLLELRLQNFLTDWTIYSLSLISGWNDNRLSTQLCVSFRSVSCCRLFDVRWSPQACGALAFAIILDPILGAQKGRLVSRIVMMMEDRVETHFESDKPTATMAATDVLLSLTVLLEMHVKMFLHVLFTHHRIRKSDATLFTLNRQTTINKRNIWTTSKVCTVVSDAAGENPEGEDVPIYVRRVELDILR